MGSVSEKRRFARLNILTDITYTRSSISDKEKLSLTRNISEGGICFIAYEKLDQDEVLDVNIFIPDHKNPVAATGKVAWVSEFVIGDPSKGVRYDVGFEFLKIADNDRKELDKCVVNNLPAHA